ncbi:unnamed protein product [Closterium sp. NIES-53]
MAWKVQHEVRNEVREEKQRNAKVVGRMKRRRRSWRRKRRRGGEGVCAVKLWEKEGDSEADERNDGEIQLTAE